MGGEGTASWPAGPVRAVPPAEEESPTLEALVAATARGDRDAFSALYDALAASVFGLVRRVVRDPAQSEEVTQEVLVEVWRTASRYDPSRAGVTTWVLTIAHRRAVDRVRAEESASARERHAGARGASVAHDSVSEQVEHRWETRQVRQALGSLTALQREAVTLAYYQGCTYREVAELLDVPLGTVKTRLRDGLIRLRDAMGVDA